jgi:hypothetical protein
MLEALGTKRQLQQWDSAIETPLQLVRGKWSLVGASWGRADGVQIPQVQLVVQANHENRSITGTTNILLIHRATETNPRYNTALLRATIRDMPRHQSEW